MPVFLQRSLTILFEKFTPFEKNTKQYDKIVAGYQALYSDNHQLCTDLLAKLRESTLTKCNLAMLKYVTESNCRWMSKIGINPATYAAQSGSLSNQYESKLNN